MGCYAREPYYDPDFDVDLHMAKARNYEKKLAGGEMSETNGTKTMKDLLATLVCCVEEDLANGLDIRSKRTRAAWDAIDSAHAATEKENAELNSALYSPAAQGTEAKGENASAEEAGREM